MNNDDSNNYNSSNNIMKTQPKASSNGAPSSPSSSSTLPSFKHLQMALHDEEQNLLRECIHALQYVNGDLIRFQQLTKTNTNKKQYSWSNIDNNDQEEDDHESTIIQNNLHTIQIRNGLLPFYINPTAKTIHKSTRMLSTGSLDALHICSEAGWLYSRIMNYIQFIQNQNGGGSRNNLEENVGVVPRALASALMNELQSYHTLLSSLEMELLQQDKQEQQQLTSRQLMIRLREPITQLRTMAIMIDGIDPSLNGGQLLTALYLHSIHGDMRHVSLVNRILYDTSLPWYDLLYDWCINGVLLSSSKPSSSVSRRISYMKNEFFIQENNDSSTLDDLWHERFLLNKDQIPSLPSIGNGNGGLITESLANEILIVGKGINFIRKCLHDSRWSLDVQTLVPQKEWDRFIADMKSSQPTMSTTDDALFQAIKKFLGFHYDCDSSRRLARKDLSGQCGEIITQSPLEKTISAAAKQVHQHILNSLFEDHHLLEHLKGLKEILLLGQGDFICTLMDLLNVEFESHKGRGVDEIYMHNMIGILHEAFRSTNAKFLPKAVLQRVRVKLLKPDNRSAQQFWIDATEHDNNDLDGWDIFSLGYDIEAPLTAVVHPASMKKYHDVFDLLFRLKRIEWMLNNTWRQSTVLNHALQYMTSKYGESALGSSASIKRGGDIARMKRLLRTFSLTRQSMLHFVSNFQSYLMFEVLESGWKSLVSLIRNAKTLDEVIAAHDKYIDEIVIKSLLDTLGDHEENRGDNELGLQLRKVLSIAYKFCKTHEKIFSDATRSIEKAAEKRRGAERRSTEGMWGFDNVDPDVDGYYFYNLSDDKVLKEIISISEQFEGHHRSFLAKLYEKVNGIKIEAKIASPIQTPSLFKSNDSESLIQSDDSLRFLTFRLDFSGFYNQ